MKNKSLITSTMCLLPILFLSGCNSIGDKETSMSIIHLATSILSLGLLLGIYIAVFLIAASPGIFDIYYKSVTLEQINGVSVLNKEYGPWHSVYLFYLLGYFVLMATVTIHAITKKKTESTAHAIIIIIAVFVNICVWLLEQLIKIDFEFLSVSYIITELFLICVYLMIEYQEGLIASLQEKL